MASISAWCAFASPRKTRRCTRRWTGSRGSSRSTLDRVAAELRQFADDRLADDDISGLRPDIETEFRLVLPEEGIEQFAAQGGVSRQRVLLGIMRQQHGAQGLGRRARQHLG